MKKAAPKKAKKALSSLKIPLVCGSKKAGIVSFHNDQGSNVSTGVTISLPVADHVVAEMFKEKGKYLLTITKFD